MVKKQADSVMELKQNVYGVLSSVNNLPTVPFIINEVTKVIEDPNASAAKLGNIISRDQGLVAKILTVANSPLYGIPRRVSTIDFAIVILGFNHIKNIVIALSMMETMKVLGDGKFPQKKYWLHSIMTAITAKKIADDLGYNTSGEAFTAGLLHDLGIPVIFKYFPDEYDQIIKAVENNKLKYEDAEKEYLGVTHGEIGKFLIDRWNLPVDLSEVVVFHHHPSNAENNYKLVSLIHLADYMTHLLMENNFHWDSDFSLDESVIDILQLGDKDYMENFVKSYKEIFESQIANFNY